MNNIFCLWYPLFGAQYRIETSHLTPIAFVTSYSYQFTVLVLTDGRNVILSQVGTGNQVLGDPGKELN